MEVKNASILSLPFEVYYVHTVYFWICSYCLDIKACSTVLATMQLGVRCKQASFSNSVEHTPAFPASESVDFLAYQLD